MDSAPVTKNPVLVASSSIVSGESSYYGTAHKYIIECPVCHSKDAEIIFMRHGYGGIEDNTVWVVADCMRCHRSAAGHFKYTRDTAPTINDVARDLLVNMRQECQDQE